MDGLKCPHCGSKYVIYKGTTDSVSKSSKNYQCQGCSKTFSLDTDKQSAQGIWLMTFCNGERGYSEQFIEVYRAPSGAININQKKSGKYVSREITLQLYVQANSYISDENNRYFLTVSSYNTPNDPNGTLFSVDEIRMNDELTKQAMQNEAMKITWNGSCFNLTKYRSSMISNDICTFLRPRVGAQGKKGCYVATAVYGSYDCPQVWTLRRFRDDTLAGTWYGRAFIRAYYAISPTLVKWFGDSRWFRKLWRGPLDRMVRKLQRDGVENTPYEDRSW